MYLLPNLGAAIMSRKPTPVQDVSLLSTRPQRAQKQPTVSAHDTNPDPQPSAPTPSTPPNGAPVRRKPVPKSHPSPKKSQPKKRDKTLFSTYEKIGLLAACYLVVGSTCILVAIGFLWFLWLADFHNSTWHSIADHNWFTRIAALSALVIRTAASFQSMAATAMIGALGLEQMLVLLLNLASVSTLRNANGGPYLLFWWLWKAFFYNPRRGRMMVLLALVTSLTLMTALVQLTSFTLLSDLNLRVTPSKAYGSTLGTNFAYNKNGTIPVVARSSTWLRKPPFYPTFAEYHQPPPTDLEDGISDTGLTLRAFVPLQDGQSRSLLATWEGRANVLDSRVVCMRPNLTLEKVHIADGTLALTGLFNAQFNASTSGVELWTISFNDVVNPLSNWDSRPAINFTCLAPLSAQTATGSGLSQNNQSLAERSDIAEWRLSICQPYGLTSPGSLVSEFQRLDQEPRLPNSDPNYAYGDAYLVINVSSGSEFDWASVISEEDSRYGTIQGPGTSPLSWGTHGPQNEWYDLIYKDDASMNLSISLCYTAFDTADLTVTISSSRNRSEPAPMYDAARNSYNYNRIRSQLGQTDTGAFAYDISEFDARGILSLENRSSWVPDHSKGDYQFSGQRITETCWITDFANMAGPIQNSQFDYRAGYEWTGFLWNGYREPGSWVSVNSIWADPSMIALVQEILQNGGSIAFAMQSIITVLTGVAYYDQLQQFNDVNNVTQTTFNIVTAPVKNRGLIAVTVVLGAYLILILGIILPLFLKGTTVSTLGNAWQAVAQVYAEKTKEMLEKAPLAVDSVVEEVAKRPEGKKRKPNNHEIVGIGLAEDGRGTEIMCVSDGYAQVAAEEGR
jgi:hypothetical protein